MKNIETKRSVWSFSFFPVLLTFFIDNFGLAIVYPIFTSFFLRPGLHLLAGNFSFFHRTILLGIMIATFPIAQAIGAPLLGSLSDRVGRKKIFIATLSGCTVGYLLTGIGIHFQMITVLWIGRALAGFFAGNLTLCLAAISDISKTQADRAHNFGYVGMIGGLGFVLAIISGSILSNPTLGHLFHPEVPFYLTALFAVITLILMLIFFVESREVGPRDKRAFFEGARNIFLAFQTKGIRTTYLGYFFFMLGWLPTIQFLSATLIHNYHVSIKGITITFVGVGLIWSIANFLLHPLLLKILPARRLFTVGLMGTSLFLFLTLIPHEPFFVFLIHIFLATVFAALSWTNGLATISLSGTPIHQGSILGVNQGIVAVASIIGPLVGGILAGIDFHQLYLFTATSCFIAAILLSVKKW